MPFYKKNSHFNVSLKRGGIRADGFLSWLAANVLQKTLLKNCGGIMQFQFIFKHMESSPSLQTYATDKFKDLVKRYVAKPVEAIVTISVEKGSHILQFSAKNGDGFNVEVRTESEDMHASVDLAVEKIKKQLMRQKGRIKQHTGRRPRKTIQFKSAKFRDEIDIESAEIDASDIIKFEHIRKQRAS